MLVRTSLQRVYQVIKVVQPEENTGTDSVMVVGALTHCAIRHSLFYLKSTQMNAQRSLIREHNL